mgnify:CR=1 FL=1
MPAIAGAFHSLWANCFHVLHALPDECIRSDVLTVADRTFDGPDAFVGDEPRLGEGFGDADDADGARRA